MKRKHIVLGLVICLVITVISSGALWARQSRLSAAVALVSKGSKIEEFLTKPGVSYVQAYVRFGADFPDDVIIALDQELIEGVNKPLYVKGGDWMSLVGVQRSGAVWVATGTEATMRGEPSKERNWKILDLKTRLEPDIWYKIRIEADFDKRYYKSFSIDGLNISQKLDLSAHKLDYPNYMPFDSRSMSYYVIAMRGRDMMKVKGTPLVYFDDVEAGVAVAGSPLQAVFSDGFETQQNVGAQPVIAPIIQLENYRQKFWYLERDESIITIQQQPFARSGTAGGVADASLD